MLSVCLTMVIGLLAVCWGFFFDLLEPMMPGNTGVTWFLGVFFALFVINKFIDLFVMNFIYSPSTGDATMSAGLRGRHANVEVRHKVKGSKNK